MMRWVILSACTIALVSFAQADPPKNYYATAIDKTGNELRSALHDIIDDHRVIKYSSSNPDTADALAKLDADSDNPNNVILIYSRRSEAISNFGTSSGWNREHLWCNSYGIDKRGPAYSDLHNLKPADASVNSARSNKIYDISDTRDAKYQKPGHPAIPRFSMMSWWAFSEPRRRAGIFMPTTGWRSFTATSRRRA